MECRTAALGGHIQRCPEGHVQEVWYNSCRHRSCPQCSHLARERWLEKQRARLLAGDHFHLSAVLGTGRQVIRYYGLYARQGQQMRERCRAQLGRVPEQAAVVLAVEQYWEKAGHPEKLCCPVCGQRMISVDRFARGGSPPGEQDRPFGKAQDRQAA